MRPTPWNLACSRVLCRPDLERGVRRQHSPPGPPGSEAPELEPWPPRGALPLPSNKSVCSFGLLLFSLFFCPLLLNLPSRSFFFPNFPFLSSFSLSFRSLFFIILLVLFCIFLLYFGPLSASGSLSFFGSPFLDPSFSLR